MRRAQGSRHGFGKDVSWSVIWFWKNWKLLVVLVQSGPPLEIVPAAFTMSRVVFAMPCFCCCRLAHASLHFERTYMRRDCQTVAVIISQCAIWGFDETYTASGTAWERVRESARSSVRLAGAEKYPAPLSRRQQHRRAHNYRHIMRAERRENTLDSDLQYENTQNTHADKM